MNLETTMQIVLIFTCIAVLIKARPFNNLRLPRFKNSNDEYNKMIEHKYSIVCRIIRNSDYENLNPIRLKETKKNETQINEGLKQTVSCLMEVINTDNY